MIEFIKEYGISDEGFEYILKNARPEVLENIALTEISVRETLDYYNSIGIQESIASLIVLRPDLILTSKDNIKEIVSKIDVDIFVNLANKQVSELVVLGI